MKTIRSSYSLVAEIARLIGASFDAARSIEMGRNPTAETLRILGIQANALPRAL